MPQTTPLAETRRLRVLAVVAASGCLVLGLALQLLARTPLIDVLGSMLYVVFFGLLIVLVWPRLSALTVTAIALAVAMVIELLQLTPAPAAIVAALPVSRLLFGSAFDPMDLAAYVAGAVLLWLLLALLRVGAARVARGGR
ncbi:glycopeptide antibiotics resistance protein [Agromyces sp. 3263]|uniref:ribosomal maturation YjgA family protein n=1 Tax=Agromyces sp. 3263 TaxID=2817750 RepID=UPI00286683D4|nr:DUF2809 domain-containing protein [Agromyces sp. 3263]MDR6906167.1 glycopeptide antibiotics resistance protein [Agromyces sp. 3263]